MSKTFKRKFAIFALICCLALLVPVSVSFAEDETDTATYGTPQLGAEDPLWDEAMEHVIDQSTLDNVDDEEEEQEDPGPRATGTARILWDEDYVYARVEVEDEDAYFGDGSDHTYDGVEFYVGSGSNGSNQWRISTSGIWSGQNAQGRAGWTQETDTGYIVEVRIPKRDVELAEGPLTFEIYINNSSSSGGDRYEVVSAFGEPDSGFGGSGAFTDSVMLVEADEVDARYSITATAGSGGSISPTAPGNVFRVEKGGDITFTFTPSSGQVIDAVTVDGEEVSVEEDNTYTIENVSANSAIHATFQYDPGAELFDFIVWNDNFADGEYTTAVIIDLGESNAVNDADLNSDMFAVTARDTSLDGTSEELTGSRNISRVYVNDEPAVRGYQGPLANSPDYQDGLESGRYIVVELAFFTASGGVRTIVESNSTLQIYEVVQNEALNLIDGRSFDNVVYAQDDVVNPILDRFETYSDNGVNRSVYMHRNGNGEVVDELPLYVYIHGMSRGGDNPSTDQKAAMKSANGAVALMQRMDENPNEYASHVLNISYPGTGTPDTADVKAVIDDLVASGAVDSNRIYVAGFSWGGAYTNTLLNTYPGFFAAGAPMSPVFGSPEAATDDTHADLAYWMFVNSYDGQGYQDNLETFINENLPEMTNARASLFDSNRSHVWPYNQFDQPEQNPPLPDWLAHEVEAAVLYNNIYEDGWDMAPTAGELAERYSNVFDWMFAQSLEGELVEEPDPEPEPEPEPAENEVRDTVTVDSIEEIINEGKPYRVESADDSLVAELPVELLMQLASVYEFESFTVEAEAVNEATLPALEGINRISTFYDFNLLVGSAEYVSEFQEPITLTFSIDVDDVTNPDNLRLVYIDDNGEVEYHAIESYNAETGEVIVKVDHFSVYGIAELDAEEVIEDLEEQISDLTERLEELEDLRAEDAAAYAQEIAALRAEIEALQASEEALFDTVTALLVRVEALEDRVAELEETEEDETVPGAEDSEDPQESEDPEDETEADDEDDEDEVVESEDQNGEGTLPATATSLYNYLAFGLFLIVVGMAMVLIKRRKSIE